MLQRFKSKRSGSYSAQEKAEIEAVTALILGNALTYHPSKRLTILEKDYVRYIRVATFYYSGSSFIMAGLGFLFVDRLPLLNRLRGLGKWGVKVATFGLFYSAGVYQLKRKMLEFPLLDDVIAIGVIKYTKWMEIPPDAVLEDRSQVD